MDGAGNLRLTASASAADQITSGTDLLTILLTTAEPCGVPELLRRA
jgi:hypothetical protein